MLHKNSLPEAAKHIHQVIAGSRVTELLHHFLHLLELGQQLVHLLNCRSTALGDALFAVAINHFRLAPLLICLRLMSPTN